MPIIPGSFTPIRDIWAMLAKDEHYDAAAWQRHPVHQPPLAGNA